MVLRALIVTGALTVDRTIPVSALKGGVVGDASPRPMTAIARCLAICIRVSFPLRIFKSVSRQTRQPCEARHSRPRQLPVRAPQTYGQKVTCASAAIGLSRFYFWTGVCRFVRARMRHAEVQPLCPVSRATEILGDRWTLLIVREMMLGSHRFNGIERGLPGISRSLLASRLRNLVDAGIVERLPGARSKLPEYSLSETGRDLKKVIEALGAWGVRCAFGEPRPEELDAALLVWKIHQRINRDLLPQKRTVVEFDFTDLTRTAHGWSCNHWKCQCA